MISQQEDRPHEYLQAQIQPWHVVEKCLHIKYVYSSWILQWKCRPVINIDKHNRCLNVFRDCKSLQRKCRKNKGNNFEGNNTQLLTKLPTYFY